MSRINNSFRFTGNLGTDPEVRYNPNNGDPIASIHLAVDASYKNRETGEKVEKVAWFEVRSTGELMCSRTQPTAELLKSSGKLRV